jgi:hypothetical protein
MESNSAPRDPDHARAALVAADQARERLSAGLRLPRGLHPVLGGAVALQIGTAAVGIMRQTTAGMVLLGAGLAVFLAVAGWALLAFRRINGVRVDGFASQVVLGTGAVATTTYVGAFVVATWAAFESQWWLVVAASVAGGVGYALGARQWWHAYRADPAAHAAGSSLVVLAILALSAIAGLVALVVMG